MTRALVVAPQPFFTPRGTPFSVYYRTLAMAGLGVSCDILTYGQGEDVRIDGLRIVRIPSFRFLGPIKVGPSPQKLFLDIFMVFWTFGMLCRRCYAFVHAHEEAIFFLQLMKPIFRFKLIYDMHSSLPEQLTNYKFTTSRTVINTFAWLERQSLKRSDAVITICPELAKQAVPLMPDPTRHFLIENSIFDPVQLDAPTTVDAAPAPAPQVVVPDGRPVILYAGTFEAYQGLDLLVDGFARLQERRPDAFLLLVGGTGAALERTREQVARLNLENACAVHPRVPQTTVRALMQQAAILVSPRVTGTNTPLKIYEQLASGIPLVATRILSHTQVLNEETAMLVEPTAEGFAHGLLQVLEDAGLRERLIDNAKTLYASAYARDVYDGKLKRLLDRLDVVVAA